MYLSEDFPWWLLDTVSKNSAFTFHDLFFKQELGKQIASNLKGENKWINKKIKIKNKETKKIEKSKEKEKEEKIKEKEEKEGLSSPRR